MDYLKAVAMDPIKHLHLTQTIIIELFYKFNDIFKYLLENILLRGIKNYLKDVIIIIGYTAF